MVIVRVFTRNHQRVAVEIQADHPRLGDVLLRRDGIRLSVP